MRRTGACHNASSAVTVPAPAALTCPHVFKRKVYNSPVSSTIPAGPSGGPVTTEPASHQLEATTLRISASLTLVPGVPGAPMGSGMISAHLPLLQTLQCCPQAPSHPNPSYRKKYLNRFSPLSCIHLPSLFKAKDFC